MFETFFKNALGLARVERAAINSADASSGRFGDVNCYDVNDELVLSVEVKERSLSLSDCSSVSRNRPRSSCARLKSH